MKITVVFIKLLIEHLEGGLKSFLFIFVILSILLAGTTIQVIAQESANNTETSCAGLKGEEFLLCKGNIAAFDAGGTCEDLTSLECLEKSIDLDGDGIHNEIDQCPNDQETINSINDEDGCPEELPTYSPDEVKEAYDGLTNEIQDKVSEPIIEEFKEIPKPEPVEEEKLDTRIFEIKKIDKPDDYAKRTGIDFKDNIVRVLVIAEGQTVLEKINEIGRVEVSSENLFQVELETDKIDILSQLEEVKSIRTLIPAIQTQTIVSEGVQAVKADLIKKGGLSGEGVKIAVFDLAFDLDNEKIKNQIKDSKSFRHGFDNSIIPVEGASTEYVHGTAVVEIIIDIAPDAEIYLYTFSTEVEFLDALSYAMTKDVDLMTMSAGWISYPTDGKSFMTKKIEEVIEQGTPFVISAGNYAQTHWEGKLVDDDSDGWHEFQSDDEGLSFEVKESRVDKIPIIAFLMWDNLDNKINDFDLTLKDPTGEIVAFSSNVQGQHQQNVEYIYYLPEKAGTYSLGVSYAEKQRPSAAIEIFSQYDMLEHSIAPGSVGVPTDAKGVIAVGAIHHSKGVLEPFSSQGPPNNEKQPVPNLVAPDGVTTLAYEGTPFYGTSAAAPHVAGIIALLLEIKPNISTQDVVDLLEKNTDRNLVLNQTEFDNIFGYGKADATFLKDFLGVLPEIPSWIKNNAGWWADGLITDRDFVKGIEYLIKNDVLTDPSLLAESDPEKTMSNSVKVYQLPTYKNTENVEIAGVIDDYKRGTPVTITISGPNDYLHELELIASKSGQYSTFYEITHEATTGRYDISVEYYSIEVQFSQFDIVEELEDTEQVLEIPNWIKNNAGWWSKDKIADSDFIYGIQFLITNGVMKIS